MVANILKTDIEWMEFIGAGRTGKVWKGIWRAREVAIKKLEDQDKLIEESKYLSQLKHSNIVILFGSINEYNIKALVMELAPYGSLYHENRFAYRLWHVMFWLLQCARGLSFMHKQITPLIHRDIKSLNLLIFDGRTKLKICDMESTCFAQTLNKDVVGTVQWMAPEVIRKEEYNTKSDIYSFSIVFWELLTRKLPWKRFESQQIMIQVGQLRKRPPLIKELPRELEVLLTSCWAENPNDRPSDTELEAILIKLLKYCPIPKRDDIQNSSDSDSIDEEFNGFSLFSNHLRDKDNEDIRQIQVKATKSLLEDFKDFHTIKKIDQTLKNRRQIQSCRSLFGRHSSLSVKGLTKIVFA